MKSNQSLCKLFIESSVICFDFDSTLVKDESILGLARLCGVEQEITELTNGAMKGTMTFQESLTKRLNIINPTHDQVQLIANSNKFPLTEGVLELIKLLQEHNKIIYVISGGFLDLLLPITDKLLIPKENIYANTLLFDDNGSYIGFKDVPTSRTGGKLEIIKQIKEKHKNTSIVHIGDGKTDLETKPIVDLFIGFGGNIIRDCVKNESDLFIDNFDILINLLKE